MLKRLFAVAIFLWLAACGWLYGWQENVLFHFLPVDESHAFAFDMPTREVWLDRPDGARLNGVVFLADEPRRGAIVYYKGNAGNVGHSESMARIFTPLGFDVVSMDYRGFGKSRGEMSEDALIDDAVAWYDWTKARYAEEDVRIVGYSLGTSLSAQVAERRLAGDVILFAPMKSVLDVGQRRYPFVPSFLARYPLRSDLALADAGASRIVIYHGTEDEVIPLASGIELKPLLGPDDAFEVIEGADHVDLPWRAEVVADINRRWGRGFQSANSAEAAS